MLIKKLQAYKVTLFLAGPIEKAKDIIREECFNEGLCVTIKPTTFIYTGGEEEGYEVGFINYPKFPKDPSDVYLRARDLALKLLKGTFQHSVLITDDYETEWITLREMEMK